MARPRGDVPFCSVYLVVALVPRPRPPPMRAGEPRVLRCDEDRELGRSPLQEPQVPRRGRKNAYTRIAAAATPSSVAMVFSAAHARWIVVWSGLDFTS